MRTSKSFIVKYGQVYFIVRIRKFKNFFKFLVFWNADKPQYQLLISKKVAGFIFKGEDNKSDLINTYEEWIFGFVNEFMKKFVKIDFLRMDKYLMFSDQIISIFLVECVNKKKFSSLGKFLENLSLQIKTNNYNFSFEANILRILSRFIEYIFNKEHHENHQNVDTFIQNYFLKFFEKLLQLFYDVKDKREIKIFEEVVIISVVKGLQKKTNEKIENDVKVKCKEFLEKNEKKMVQQKIKILNFLIKKIENENYQGEEDINMVKKKNVVDPVHDYILTKNYTAKFRKSPLEKKKEMLEKKKQEKKAKEEKKKENLQQKEKEKNKKEDNKEENAVTEEIIQITDEDEENAKKEKQKEKKEVKKKENESDKTKKEETVEEDEKDDELVEEDDDDDDDNEDDEDDDMNNDIELEEDEDIEEEDEDDLYEEDEDFDEDDYLNIYEDEEEMALDNPENKQIKTAFENSIKNMQILQKNTAKNYNNFLGQKTKLNSNKKQKNSNNSTPPNSNTNSSNKKRKVKYALENNVTNVYDRKVPILLTSKKKEVLPKGEQANKKKSLLKKKK